jgi:hypothetical protein
VNTVHSIYNTPSHLNNGTSGKLLFLFEQTKEAALHNAIVLQCYNFDIDQAIQAQHNSSIIYGSEFRPISDLSPLLSTHPLWVHIQSILSKGATFPLLPIPDPIRQEDLIFHKDRGIHKSASKHSEKIQQLLKDDVERGFALILPVEVLPLIPNASLAPLGCQEQKTLNAAGDRVSKFRMTHDQSFLGPSGSSVNMRVETSKQPPCMYGYCLRHIIHYILSLRQ